MVLKVDGPSPKVSVCIPCHNQGHLLPETLDSCIMQEYKNIEIIVLDDASDIKLQLRSEYRLNPTISGFRSEEASGSGGAFNKAMSFATGDIIVLMCADDIFTSPLVFSDIVENFNRYPQAVHISRYYHQFIDGDRRPVRAWRCGDVIELANNPSGLAFRKSAIGSCQLSNKMFVEAPSFVACIRKDALSIILPYDTVAVRIHKSTARSKDYYKTRWVSSPIEEWTKIGGEGLQKDFTSLIQIKNYFTISGVLKECWNFIKLNPFNIINPAFILFSLISVFTPRFILTHLPHLYRVTWGRWTTSEMKRP